MSKSRLDYIEDEQVREQFKLLIDRLGILENRVQQGNVNIVFDGNNPSTLHAVTHSSKRAGTAKSGTDPIDKYPFDWTDEHDHQPSGPTKVPTTYTPHANQTADQVKVKDPEGAEQNTVDPRGNATFRTATVKGAVNARHGGPGSPPNTFSGLLMWFDARTIGTDNPEIEYGEEISTWVDRTKTYTATAEKSDPGETLAKWRQRLLRGTVVNAVDCNYREGTGAFGDFVAGDSGDNAAVGEDGATVSARWFSVSPEYQANNATSLTIFCVCRHPYNVDSQGTPFILGVRETFDGEDQNYVTPWPHAIDENPVIMTQPTMQVQGASPAPSEVVAVARAASSELPANGGAGMGFWQMITYVLEPVTGANDGRKAKKVRLNGFDHTLSGGITIATEDTLAEFDIKQIAGPGGEYCQIVVFEGELSAADISSVEDYFGAIYNWNTREFVAAAEGMQASYALTLQKDGENWIGFRTNEQGITEHESTTDHADDRARLIVRPAVIATANYPADPDVTFRNGELLWADLGSGSMVLLAVIDTDGAGTLKFIEMWRT